MNSQGPVSRVVVLGAGYAGLTAAVRLARQTDGRVEVTLVNGDEMFGDRVRNHQRAAGQAVRRHPVRSFLRGTRIQFLLGTVTAINLGSREVTVETPVRQVVLGYDHLIYALGSFVRTGDLPGALEHAYTLDRASAQALATRLSDPARQDGRLLVVGAGNTGVEVATELAESYPRLHVTLATRRSFARQLSPSARAHIRRAFDRLGIRFLEHTAIVSFGDHEARTEHGATVSFDVCVVVAGFAVPDLARRTGLRVNDRGQVLIDRAMRSLSHPEVYAAGDAAAPEEAPGAPIRMAAYTALIMGAHAADSLAAHLKGRAPTAFGLSYQAAGISLGRRDGVVQFLDEDRDTPRDRIITGKAASFSREFFVRLILGIIKAQRLGPWTFPWPGKNKMRGVAVPAPGQTISVPVRMEPMAGGER